MRGTHSIFTIVFVIAVIAAISFSFGYYRGSQRTFSNNLEQKGVDIATTDNSFDAGWEAAKQKIEESGIIRNSNIPITTLKGSIQSIADDNTSFVIQTQYRVRNPLANQPPEVRTIIVNEDTQYISRIEKSRDQLLEERDVYQRERNELRAKAQSGEFVLPQQPERYTEEEVDFTSLNLNKQIIIRSVDQEDIGHLETITAGIIYIMEDKPSAYTEPVLKAISQLP